MLKQLKFPLVTGLFVIGSVASAATSAQLNLSGTVSPVLRIGFNAAGSVTTASYSFSSSELVDGFSGTSVGTLYDSSNNRTSNYKVTVTSANGGKLTHASVAGAEVDYTLSIAGTTVSSAELDTPADFTVDTSAYTGRVTVPRGVTMSGGNTEALAGAYSDTVTFEISAI